MRALMNCRRVVSLNLSNFANRDRNIYTLLNSVISQSDYMRDSSVNLLQYQTRNFSSPAIAPAKPNSDASVPPRRKLREKIDPITLVYYKLYIIYLLNSYPLNSGINCVF